MIVVANHPHGLIDGMLFAARHRAGAGRTTSILTRTLLTAKLMQIAGIYMIPVPFPHDEDALERKGVEMRKAMRWITCKSRAALIALFPVRCRCKRRTA